MWLRFRVLPVSPFEVVLAEEAEQATSSARFSFLPRSFSTEPSCNGAETAAPPVLYSEFYDAADVAAGADVPNWRDLALRLERLSPAELKALRRAAAYNLHPDRASSVAESSERELAVLNARIDERLRMLVPYSD